MYQGDGGLCIDRYAIGRYFEQRMGWAVTQTWHLVEEDVGDMLGLYPVLTEAYGWGRYFEQRVGWAVTQTWHLVEKDVEDTLEAVGDRVLAERGTEPAVLRRRAEGMRVIAKVFQARPRVCRLASRAGRAVCLLCCSVWRACASLPRSSRFVLGFI